MALKKILETPQGYEAEYINIPAVVIHFCVYKDEDARHNNKTPVISNRINIDFAALTEEQQKVMYDILKMTEEVIGAVDIL